MLRNALKDVKLYKNKIKRCRNFHRELTEPLKRFKSVIKASCLARRRIQGKLTRDRAKRETRIRILEVNIMRVINKVIMLQTIIQRDLE